MVCKLALGERVNGPVCFPLLQVGISDFMISLGEWTTQLLKHKQHEFPIQFTDLSQQSQALRSWRAWKAVKPTPQSLHLSRLD